jgi:hypothetical protein
MARAAIIINEFSYDDGGTDDKEFVELYNNGGAAVDISGWTLSHTPRPEQSVRELWLKRLFSISRSAL